MRGSAKALVVVLCAVVGASSITVAGALISSSTGSVTKLSAAPSSVKLNALENATNAVAFDERQNVTLGSAVAVDAVNPGTYSSFPSGSATIPAGTVVDSHLVHSDIPSRNYNTHRVGTVTLANDIVGVIASTNRLGATDAALGAPGTQYAGTTNYRGLEGNEYGFASLNDKFTISADRRTLSFDIQTFLIDEIRVITKHANTLVTTVTDSPDPVQAGDNVTYTISVKNTGTSTAANVSVKDEFPGATFVSASAPGSCTTTSTTVTCALGSIAVNATATATVVVKSGSSAGTLTNTATAPPGETPATITTTSVVSPDLDTTIEDDPDAVTVGNDVQYTLTVTNNGIAPVANVHVIDTLPAGTTFKSSDGTCTGTTTIDCTLGTLAVNASATVKLLVQVPGTVPEGGTITNSAVATPGSNTAATKVTPIEEPTDGVSKGFVSPGGSISTGGNDPATLTLPNTGDGAGVEITQGDGTFCDGPCEGPATTINSFPGYTDPNNPIRLVLEFNFSGSETSLTEAATAFNADIYKLDPEVSSTGVIVPDCDVPGAGVAVPHPCVDGVDIAEPEFGHYVVTFVIVYLSGDPSFARR